MEKYGALERPSEFMRACNKMNFTVQNTGGYVSSQNEKIEIPNKIWANITTAIMIK